MVAGVTAPSDIEQSLQLWMSTLPLDSSGTSEGGSTTMCLGILYADNSVADWQPRLAEIVASRLRDDILSGRLKEGDVPPPQESLFGEFGVSPRRCARPSTSWNQTDWFPSAAAMSGGRSFTYPRRSGRPT